MKASTQSAMIAKKGKKQSSAHQGLKPMRFSDMPAGMAVSISNALHVEKYAGVSYYFCCDGCRTTFLKDPGKYAAIHQVSLPAGGSRLESVADIPPA